MIVPDPNYRPNPGRAIYIDGEIGDVLLSKITPQILKLQSQNRGPISVYIVNSPGGNVGTMETILRMLKSRDQDAGVPCRLITVVATKAASAAADLLSSGDYSIAYPESTLLYHGIRTPGLLPAFQAPLTAERTSFLTHILRLGNDFYAMELARKIESRFMLRFIISRPDFEAIRAKHAPKEVSDLDCFLELTSGKLSQGAQGLFQKARERYQRYEALLDNVIKKTKPRLGLERPAKIEADRIKAIVNFELAQNKHNPSWTFSEAGLSRLADDFFLLTEYLALQKSERLQHWCKSIGKFSLTHEELAEIENIPDEKARDEELIKRVQPPVQPLWSFFGALCHALQEGENTLTAVDAYWLGLVDEVMGNDNLLTTRWFAEWRPDEPKPEIEPVQQQQA